MPTDIKRLEARMLYTHWYGNVLAEEVIADQARGNALISEAHDPDYAMIMEFDKGVRLPVDFRLVKTIFSGAQTPLFVVIIGSSSAIKTLVSTLQKMFTHQSYVHYADSLDNAIPLLRKLLAEHDAKRG